jgi:competence protein ComGC
MMKRKFTLIELFLVIAIIGILVSMVLPALSKARKASRKAVCVNQLKQIGQLNYMYTDDYDNIFPMAWLSPTSFDEQLALCYNAKMEVFSAPQMMCPVMVEKKIEAIQ